MADSGPVPPPLVRKRSLPVKVFRDNCVPGDYVRLCQTSISIVDTPPFQRLRYLKQLGMSDFVYPGATHTRFAHSLGVAHRARVLALRLKERQPELVLTDSQLVVLEAAGLCHDLGHGPFSHAFESELVPLLGLRPGEHWEHEAQSCRLVDHICETYSVDLTPGEQLCVKDVIRGDREAAQGEWPPGTDWQFDIVANKRNGLDVDKLDYLRRDNAACGELTASEFSSLYQNMRVIKGQICFRSIVRSAVQEVYAARAKMHEFVYNHSVCKACEYQVVDALLAAADQLGIREALRDPERFSLLDDTVLRDIERSSSQSPGMVRARELLHRLRQRDIYKYIGGVDIPRDKVTSFRQVTAQEVVARQDVEGSGVRLAEDDIRVHNLKIDFTAKHENPLERVGMYVNVGDTEIVNIEVVPFMPGTFITRQVRVYMVRLCESSEEKKRYTEAAQKAFAAWCERDLKEQLWMSPNKTAVTASARKRQRPGSSLALPDLAGEAGGEGAVDQLDSCLPLSQQSQPGADAAGGGAQKRLALSGC